MPASYPSDVIRKRLVVDGSATGGARQFSGFWDCVSKVWAREGVRGFYRFYG
jgi:solute carrier family 25 (adenine nucleotide translocator) protein 4/5/6/31